MPVTPRRSRATQKVASSFVRGRYKNEVAHARRWNRMKTQRLHRLSKVRPEKFTEKEKRELEHRQKYGETRAETYNKLARPFKEGLLSKGQFKKYKHALGMDEKFDDYKSYKEYMKEGLESLSENEFKKADKFVGFGFDVNEFGAYKKLKKEGLGKLSQSEFNTVNGIQGMQIASKTYNRRKNVFSAKNEGLVQEKNGKLQLKKDVANLKESEKNLLNSIGFNISDQVWRRSKQISKAKSQKLIEEKENKLYLSKDLKDYSKKQIGLLQGLDFDIPSYESIRTKSKKPEKQPKKEEPKGPTKRERLIQKAKNKGLITVKKGEPVITVGRGGVGDLSLGDVQLLQKVGIDVYRRWRTIQNRKARQKARKRRKKSRREEGYYSHI